MHLSIWEFLRDENLKSFFEKNILHDIGMETTMDELIKTKTAKEYKADRDEQRKRELEAERKREEEMEYKYEYLKDILNKAYDRAAKGKGAERHGNDLCFEDQPMQTISELIGTNHGCLFQAVKKIQESTRLGDRNAINELLDAIVYLAGAIIYIEQVSITLE